MKRKCHQVNIFQLTQNIYVTCYISWETSLYAQAVAKIQTENTQDISLRDPSNFLSKSRKTQSHINKGSSFFTGAFADHLLCQLKIICVEIFIFYMMHWIQAPKIGLKIARGTLLLPSSIAILLLFLTSFATSLPPRIDFAGENFNFIVFPVIILNWFLQMIRFSLTFVYLTHIPHDVYASESTLWCVRSRTE